MYARVQRLFGAQTDLLDEFKYFLPENQQVCARVHDPVKLNCCSITVQEQYRQQVGTLPRTSRVRRLSS